MMRFMPCGCAYDWAHSGDQCDQGRALYAVVCAARRAYHADPYGDTRLYEAWLAAERAFGAHFAHAPRP